MSTLVADEEDANLIAPSMNELLPLKKFPKSSIPTCYLVTECSGMAEDMLRGDGDGQEDSKSEAGGVLCSCEG